MVGVSREPVGGRRRWRIALIASLAVNVLLIAVIGVWLARPLFRGPPPRAEFGRVIDRMSHRLGDSDAAALRRAYDAHRDDFQRLGAGVREARDQVRAAMRAEPFDPDKLATAMGELRTARTAMEAAIQAVMQEGAAAMSADGRRTLARGPRVDDR